MTRSDPPRLAVALLRRFLRDNEPLAGDLLERFAARPDRLRFWREVLAAVVAGAFRQQDRDHPLGLTGPSPVATCDGTPRLERPRRINLSASPIPDIGGLGLVALGVLVTLVRPEAWLLVAAANLAGAALGLMMGLLGRYAPPFGSAGTNRALLRPDDAR